VFFALRHGLTVQTVREVLLGLADRATSVQPERISRPFVSLVPFVAWSFEMMLDHPLAYSAQSSIGLSTDFFDMMK
jgi:hypothetical protein